MKEEKLSEKEEEKTRTLAMQVVRFLKETSQFCKFDKNTFTSQTKTRSVRKK